MSLLAHTPPTLPADGLSRPIDEAFQADGSPREHWSGLLEALIAGDLATLAADVDADAER
jgi:hypothetical protein